MLVAVYNRNFQIEDVPLLKTLFDVLHSYEAKIILYENLVHQLRTVINLPENFTTFSTRDELNNDTDFLISLGGDGTILDTVHFVTQKNIPVLGINLGHLGFLAATNKDEIEHAIGALAKGEYIKDKRSLLHLSSNKPLFGNTPFALNDFCIQRKDSSALVKIHTYINGEFLCTYWADGLIVATPTGSTGYSMSCGGPIILPQSNSFILTPVAPHNLNVRPVVVPDDCVLSFEVEGRAKEFLCTMDARSEVIDSTYSLAIQKENFGFNLIRLEGQNFLGTIRNKLFWGIDKRN